VQHRRGAARACIPPGLARAPASAKVRKPNSSASAQALHLSHRRRSFVPPSHCPPASAHRPSPRRSSSWKRGELVPDDTVINIVRERRRCITCPAVFSWMASAHRAAGRSPGHYAGQAWVKLDAVLSYDMPLEHVIARLSGRRTCASCKAVFHVTGRPPSPERPATTARPAHPPDDDRPESIRVRMQAYQPAPRLWQTTTRRRACSCPSPRGRAGRDLPAHAYGAVVAATIAAGPGWQDNFHGAIHDLTKYLGQPEARWQPWSRSSRIWFSWSTPRNVSSTSTPGCTLVGRQARAVQSAASRTRCSPPRLPSATAVFIQMGVSVYFLMRLRHDNLPCGRPSG